QVGDPAPSFLACHVLLVYISFYGRLLTTKAARNATFSVTTRTCNVTEGKHAKLSCYVTGEPKPEIVWKKDGEVIMEGRRHIIYEDEQENFVLKILFCKQIDNGLYTCTASNLAGQTYSSVLVVVKGTGGAFPHLLAQNLSLLIRALINDSKTSHFPLFFS
uniref:Ig-like domain-containing protein n=1 Tax=Crocodylus porosus TaxID=8502 RepID=A0A7M4FS42_CROPO